MNTMHRRAGVAMVMVLFVAFLIAVGFVVMIQSGSSVASQNKRALQQLQAYYLAQSGIQHTLLKIKILPRETSIMIRDPGGKFDVFNDVTTANHATLGVLPPQGGRDVYDLFTNDPSTSPSDTLSPYWATYELKTLAQDSSLGGMKLTQDNYSFTVTGTVKPLYPENDQFVVNESLAESVIISRYNVGDGTR